VEYSKYRYALDVLYQGQMEGTWDAAALSAEGWLERLAQMQFLEGLQVCKDVIWSAVVSQQLKK
jgi:hypothetical protein